MNLAQFRLDLRDPDGTLFAQVTDFTELACVARVNAPGLLVATLPGDHAALSRLQKRSQVDLWFEDGEHGIAWRKHFSGLHLGEELAFPDNLLSTFRLIVPGDLWLLGTRVVNWYVGYADRSEFSTVAGETIMKTLVDYNCGANATVANGRKREGAISTITIEADAAGGTVLDWYCHGDNVLKSLQELAPLAGGDFDLVKTLGADEWEFRYYDGQLGTDRSATVLFALERGNMLDVKYAMDWVEEKTAAAVWGQGAGAARAYETVLGPDHAAGNDVELYVDARDIAGDLTDRGTKSMAENRARSSFTFKVAQAPGCMFGKHYFLGDLVTVRSPRTMGDEIYQVAAVGMTVSGSERSTSVELRQTGTVRAANGALEQVLDRVTRIERAISRLERLE